MGEKKGKMGRGWKTRQQPPPPTLTHQPGRMLPRDAIQCLKQDLSQISQHGLVSLSRTCEMIPQVMSCADGSGPVGRTPRTRQCHLLEVIRSNLGSVRGLGIVHPGRWHRFGCDCGECRIVSIFWKGFIFSTSSPSFRSFLPIKYIFSRLCFPVPGPLDTF